MAQPGLRKPVRLPPNAGRDTQRGPGQEGRARSEEPVAHDRWHRHRQQQRAAVRPVRRLQACCSVVALRKRDLAAYRRAPLRLRRQLGRHGLRHQRLQEGARGSRRPQLQPRAVQGRMVLLPRVPLSRRDSPVCRAGRVVRRGAQAHGPSRLRAARRGGPVPRHRVCLRRLEREPGSRSRRRGRPRVCSACKTSR